MTRQIYKAPMGGGLDLQTPPIERKGGAVINGYNYEPRPEGYRRINGYERWDGQGLPSDESYYVLNFDAGTAAISAGDTVTGATSGHTGIALIDAVVESGAYGTSDAAGYLVLWSTTGTFQDDENLQVSAVTKSVANGTATENGALTDANDTIWKELAWDEQRDIVTAVTGSGNMLGVWQFGGTTYAFRNNAGGTAAVMYKSTTSGWTAVSLGFTLDFTSGGTTEIEAGQTITGATSGATAEITAVVVQSGTWAGGDAAGYFVFATQTGTFQAENLDVGASTNLATIAGDSDAITLNPGGRYEFVNYNFFGSSNLERMYGCDGANNAFQFDGTTYIPIRTGMTTDTPTHIAAHKGYLVLAFAGGSMQFSGLRDPLSWSVVTGAGEIGIGDEITGFVSGFASALVVFARNKTAILYGSVFSGGSADGYLEVVNNEVGAVEWTPQLLDKPYFLDRSGIRDVVSTQAYGNFSGSLRSVKIKPWLDAKLLTKTATASLKVRDQSQYWLFFSDGSGLIMSMANGKPEFIPLLLDHVVHCCCSVEDSSGSEVLYFGTNDGYVRRLQSGNSFDGDELAHFIRLPFDNFRTSALKKRYHKVELEIASQANTTLSLAADFSYGNQDLPSILDENFTINAGGAFWDEGNWDEFYWSQAEGVARADISGIGTNISLAIAGTTTTADPHTINGITYHYSNRGLQR